MVDRQTALRRELYKEAGARLDPSTSRSEGLGDAIETYESLLQSWYGLGEAEQMMMENQLARLLIGFDEHGAHSPRSTRDRCRDVPLDLSEHVDLTQGRQFELFNPGQPGFSVYLRNRTSR